MCQVYFGCLDIRVLGVFKTTEDNLVQYCDTFVSCNFWTTQTISGMMKKYNHKRSISIFAPSQLSPTPQFSGVHAQFFNEIQSSKQLQCRLSTVQQKEEHPCVFLKGYILDFSYFTVINKSITCLLTRCSTSSLLSNCFLEMLQSNSPSFISKINIQKYYCK